MYITRKGCTRPCSSMTFSRSVIFTRGLTAPKWRRPVPFRVASMTTQAEKHRFVALRDQTQGHDTAQGRLQLKGVIFDMDGTLCEPQNYMFGQMRSAVQIPDGEDILDHIHALPTKQQQDEAFRKIQEIEREAMAKQIPQAGLVTLLEYLDGRKIMKGICTRNFNEPVDHLLKRHVPAHIIPFAPVITRDFRPPKPSPAGILHIARAWNVIGSSEVDLEAPPASRRLPLLMVGDSIDDMTAGRQAGCLTVLLRSPGKEALEEDEATDVVVGRLDELIALLDEGVESRR